MVKEIIVSSSSIFAMESMTTTDDKRHKFMATTPRENHIGGDDISVNKDDNDDDNDENDDDNDENDDNDDNDENDDNYDIAHSDDVDAAVSVLA